MKTLTLFYSDGENLPCQWDVEVENAVADNISNLDMYNDGQHDIEDLGIDPEEIPLIKEHGGWIDGLDDGLVTIMAIDGIETKWSKMI